MNELAVQSLQMRMICEAGRLGSAGLGKAGWHNRPCMPVRAGQGLHLAGETKPLLVAKFAALRERMSQALHT